MDKAELQEIEDQLKAKGQTNLLLTLKDTDSNQTATVNLSLYSNDPVTLITQMQRAIVRALADIGLVKLKEIGDNGRPI